MKRLTALPANRAILLDNITCPYCGVMLNPDNNTKEHVIGRRFVPKGTLNGYWNLVVRACALCNNTKSTLENDISAISLAGRYWFGASDSDDSTLSEAKRKAAASISRKTRKPVMHSQENIDFKVPFGSAATFTFNLVSPPQVESERLHELARMQMMAFFYFITFDKATKRGGFWRDGFYPLTEAHHADWGNVIHKSFIKAVETWEPRWLGNTADGFFKSIIRRHPSEECWSWALEWNKNYRLIGFFGAYAPVEEIISAFDRPKMTHYDTGDNSWVRLREEIKLSEEEEDCLFAWRV